MVTLELEGLENKFLSYLETRKLSGNTKYLYSNYYTHYITMFKKLDRESMDLFLTKYSNGVARAFLKVFKTFIIRYQEDFKISDDDINKLMRIDIMQIEKHIKRIPQSLSDKDIDKLMSSTHNERDKVMFYFQSRTGLRLMEMLNIYPKDFKWDEWHEDTSKIGHLEIKGKGGDIQAVRIPPRVMKIIELYLKKKAVIQQGRGWDEKLFNVSRTLYKKALSDAGKRALGYGVRTHSLRHYFARSLVRDKYSLLEIAELMRHKNIQNTAIYAKAEQKELEEKFSQRK